MAPSENIFGKISQKLYENVGFNTHVCLWVEEKGRIAKYLHVPTTQLPKPLPTYHTSPTSVDPFKCLFAYPFLFQCRSPHLNPKPYLYCQQNPSCIIVMLLPLPPLPNPSSPLPCIGLHLLYVYLLSLVAIGHMGLSIGQFASFFKKFFWLVADGVWMFGY